MAAFVLALAMLLAGGCALPTGDEDRPNVLILFTDDQRYDTINALGNEVIRTPNIDRLVAQGTAFTRAHIPGGMHGALCAPSRAMLMTGRSLFELHETGDVIPSAHVMLPEHLADAGYETFGTGKWHNNRQAFARAFSAGDNIFFGGMHWPADGGHEHALLNPFDSTGAFAKTDRAPAAKFSSVMFADAAIQFLRGRKVGASRDGNFSQASGAPFFAYVAFSSPHDPRTPPAPYNSWYPSESVPLPVAFKPEHPFDNGELRVRDEMLLAHPRTPDALRADLGAYYGMISEVDAQIGRIVAALEETGELDNTIIVFAGDNGLAVGNHGLLGKQNLYDHSMRVPLVIRGPGIESGARRDALVYLYDLYPTLVDLLGLDAPETVTGRSLVEVLDQPDAAVRDAVFYAYKNIQRGVRSADNWKLIAYYVDGVHREQLFNLDEDPNELNNLADDPAFGEELRRMRDLLVAESAAAFDPLDLSRDDWGIPPPESPQRVNHLAVGASLELAQPLSPAYADGDANGLIDGLQCTSDFRDGCWRAIRGEDLDVVVDLGAEKTVSAIEARFVRQIGAWIFPPKAVRVSLSDDGETWTNAGTKQLAAATETDPTSIDTVNVAIAAQPVRYVRLHAESVGVCPPWHAGAGEPAWLFIDEIVVR